MRLLLDTHAYVWLDGDLARIPAPTRALIQSHETHCLLSAASIWELAIKISIGKIQFRAPVTTLVMEYVELGLLEVLPAALPHFERICSLPHHHRDPFDRLIIAQALAEDLPIVSGDSVFDKYLVKRVWD